MMGKAKSCIGGFSIFNYVIDEKKGFELFRNGVCGETALEIFQEFKIIQDQNQKATKKLFSMVLSPQISDGERLSKKEFREVTKDFLEELGFDTKEDQLVAFCHLEKKHRHIHILANRVSLDARLKKDSFVGKKAQWAAHRVAEKYGLISAKNLMIEKIKEAEKSPVKVKKAKIYEKHLAAVKIKPKDFKEYTLLMNGFGVEFKPTINNRNELQGFRVMDRETGEEFKASDIHKSMGLKSLLESGLPLDERTALISTLLKAQEIAVIKSKENQESLTTAKQKDIEPQIEFIENTRSYFKR